MHPSNLRGPSPGSGVRGHGLLNSASRVFLFKADFVTLDTEPNTGMDLDSEVANIPVGLLLSASAVSFLRRKILSNSVSLFSGPRDFKLLELVDLLSVP